MATALVRPAAKLLRPALLVLAGLILGVLLLRGLEWFFPDTRRQTTITQSVVVERLESVAKLVTTEALVRDVVSYRQTWLGSTKRALAIVTGKAMVGVDLSVRPRITIHERERRIELVFPHARLLGVDIMEMRTYDERRGLWNPFHPADRDTIYLLARAQLAHAAQDLAVVEHAEASARQLMQGLFAPEGWTVGVGADGRCDDRPRRRHAGCRPVGGRDFRQRFPRAGAPANREPTRRGRSTVRTLAARQGSSALRRLRIGRAHQRDRLGQGHSLRAELQPAARIHQSGHVAGRFRRGARGERGTSARLRLLSHGRRRAGGVLGLDLGGPGVPSARTRLGVAGGTTMGFWNSIWRKRASDWIYAPLDAAQTPERAERQDVAPQSAYLSVWLRSMRVVNVRKGLSRFYGTVHSAFTVPHRSGIPAKFNVLATPAELKNIDAANIDRAIVVNKRLLGPIPFRGGDVEMEVGLFSIKSADLAEPFLSVLGKLSALGGTAFVSAAMPFAEPLVDGINLLTGGSDDTVLEIGVASTIDKMQTGYWIVMRAPKGEVDVSKLHVSPTDYKLLDPSGQPVAAYPYMVLAIEAAESRADWAQIPEILQAHKALMEDVRNAKYDDAKQSLTVFKRVALTSDDLLLADGKRLAAEVESEVTEILKATQTAGFAPRAMRKLGDIPLY